MNTLLVTGGSGMIGSALRNILPNKGFSNVVFLSSREGDLRDTETCFGLFRRYKPDYVIHLAAKVGGVKANSDYIGDFFKDNILINVNVLEAARIFNVKKAVSLLSTCVYPNKVTYPLTENQFHNGEPHSSNFGYAYAKRMLDVQSRAYREQYDCNFITAIPNNLFGENDNFDLQDSHVIPAMIRKIYEAKQESKKVTLWGDGAPLREFTYSEDLAEILLFLLEKYNGEHPINIGNTKEFSIKEIAHMLCEILEYDRNLIIWDKSQPAGQFKKPSNNIKLLDLGWEQEKYSNFKQVLKKVCNWFILNYPNVRGAN